MLPYYAGKCVFAFAYILNEECNLFISCRLKFRPCILTQSINQSTHTTVYYGGVSEFSSIFLCIIEFFQVHPTPPSSSSILSMIEMSSQIMFVLTFFIFRIVGWTVMTYRFIYDGLYVINNGILRTTTAAAAAATTTKRTRTPYYKPTTGSEWFLWYMMTMSILLGALQVYWLIEIFDKVSEILK